MRRSAPADVSPESPALIATIGVEVESDLSWISRGKAIDGSSPYPAVRLVPKNRTLTLFDDESAEEAEDTEETTAFPALVLVFVVSLSAAHPSTANSKAHL